MKLPAAIMRSFLSTLVVVPAAATTIPRMGAVAAGAILFAVLLALVAALTIQAVRRRGGDPAIYVLGEAVDYVFERLEPDTRNRLGRGMVRRILEWQIEYQQVVAPRDAGARPIVGSGEAMDYVLAVAEASGNPVDPVDVAEVMAVEVDYLLDIGAVGTPVEGDLP